METWEWIIVAVALVAALLLALAFVRVRRRRTHLKDRFGREYQRTVEMDGTGADSYHPSLIGMTYLKRFPSQALCIASLLIAACSGDDNAAPPGTGGAFW